jgi:predicted nucleic acid-binding protein
LAAADSSSLIAFFQGDSGSDVDLLIASLQAGELCISPVVLTEVLSEPNVKPDQANLIRQIPMLEMSDGYWLRAATNRRKLLSIKLRARLPDTLIAQASIDHDMTLITRDGDFRHFAKHCGLKLA